MKYICCVFLVVLVVACTGTKKVATSMNFDWQGHRGCRGLYPENTIPAMIHAVDLGVKTLEMDAMITKDHQVILSHDPFFNHDITTKPNGTFVQEGDEQNGKLYNLNYDEIVKFDVGLKGNPRFPEQVKMKAVKPTLAAVIDTVEAYTNLKKVAPRYYNIETKTQPFTDFINHPGPEEFVELLMKVITAKHIDSRTIIQSFDVRTLQYLHLKYPAIKTALLVENKEGVKENLTKLQFTPTIYSPEFHLVNKEMINDCKQLGMQVIPWTVNELSKMIKLRNLGVDGIITDYPNLIF